jgi:serine/threonine-protein kinase
VRRNRTTTAVAAAALLALAALAGWSLRERALADRREALGRTLASELEQIDSVLRAAHLAPKHDRRPVVRGIEERAEALVGSLANAPLAPGLAAYVRGRVALSLGRFDDARRELTAAWQAGERSADVRRALGRTLAELYEGETESARRSADEEERAEELARIETELREPALAHLAAAGEDRLRPAALTAARIALLEDRWPDAVAAAEEALAGSPWLYEALLIVSRVHLLQASDHEAAGEHDEARAALAAARPALDAAIGVGRSDPRTYDELCAYWQRVLDLDRATGAELEPAYREVLASCGAAIEVDVETATAWYKLARAEYRWA